MEPYFRRPERHLGRDQVPVTASISSSNHMGGRTMSEPGLILVTGAGGAHGGVGLGNKVVALLASAASPCEQWCTTTTTRR